MTISFVGTGSTTYPYRAVVFVKVIFPDGQ
ncbi:MAG: hypothetical protein JWM77_2504, partial [Rhodospirillales bacterium]|nr:hypothetical protein [Rhodospirillales bacterium]